MILDKGNNAKSNFNHDYRIKYLGSYINQVHAKLIHLPDYECDSHNYGRNCYNDRT